MLSKINAQIKACLLNCSNEHIPPTTEFSSKLAKVKRITLIPNFAIMMCGTFFTHKTIIYSKRSGKACHCIFPIRTSYQLWFIFSIRRKKASKF